MDNHAFKDDKNIPLMHVDDDISQTPTGEEVESSILPPTVQEETPGSKVILLSNELKRQKIRFSGCSGEC